MDLNPLGRKGYSVPKAGIMQVTLLNPNHTVVKMFLVTFDFSSMPAAHMTFLCYSLFSVPVGEEGNASPTHHLRCHLLHLRPQMSCSRSLSLQGDICLLPTGSWTGHSSPTNYRPLTNPCHSPLP